MYVRYIQDLEVTVQSVRSWATRYNTCEDRKKNRDKSLAEFNKKHTAYEKKRAANGKPEEIRKLEHDAKLSFTFLET